MDGALYSTMALESKVGWGPLCYDGPRSKVGWGPLWFGTRKSSKSLTNHKISTPDGGSQLGRPWGWDRQPQCRGGHINGEGRGMGLVPTGHTSSAQRSPSIPQISADAGPQAAEGGTDNKHCLKSDQAPPPPKQNSAIKAQKFEPILFFEGSQCLPEQPVCNRQHGNGKAAGEKKKKTNKNQQHNRISEKPQLL